MQKKILYAFTCTKYVWDCTAENKNTQLGVKAHLLKAIMHLKHL